MLKRWCAIMGVLVMAPVCTCRGGEEALGTGLREYVRERVGEFDQIQDERRAILQELADYVAAERSAGHPVRLTFVCTHNSRRSQMSQVWARAAAEYFCVSGVETYSGGTEATALNPRAVSALQRVGFEVSGDREAENPHYQVQLCPGGTAIECFSKKYVSEFNPQREFCAVMTCSDADAACPVVAGAAKRIALPFEDPKGADNTPEEAAKYDERCRQIAREMLFVFSVAAEREARQATSSE